MNACDRLSHRLIQGAAHRASPDLAERLEEEWLADLRARSAPLARLRLALGCCWAAHFIARELSTAVVPAATTAGGHAMSAYARESLPLASRRTLMLLLIALLHIALIYGFASGLGKQIIEAIPNAIQTHVIEVREQPLDQPVQLSNVKSMDFSQDSIPVPPITITVPPDELGPTTLITATTPSGSSAPVSPAVHRVPGDAGRDFPNVDDYYPSFSRTIGETGSTAVHVCVDVNGRLTAPPVVAKSSGFARLDGAALRVARAGSGHYRPTTEDGKPVLSCFDFGIQFVLTN